MIEIQDALLAHLDAGGGLLGMHVSATSFTTMPRWPEILGGHWVRGTTMHPPLDLARIRLHAGVHPVAGDDAEIEVLDERYSYLDVGDDVVVLGDHEHDGAGPPDDLGPRARSRAGGLRRPRARRALLRQPGAPGPPVPRRGLADRRPRLTR